MLDKTITLENRELPEILSTLEEMQQLINTYSDDSKRFQAVRTATNLFIRCIKEPHVIKLSQVNSVITRMRDYLTEDDKVHLRRIFNSISDKLEIIIGDVLGGKKIILKSNMSDGTC